MYIAKDWQDYTLLDAGDGMKLERWGEFTLARPDPQAIWPKGNPRLWKKAHATYQRSSDGGGAWEYHKTVPESWQVSFGDLAFKIKTMGFKHTGLFPEQAANWDFMQKRIQAGGTGEVRVLNLFAYTGGATAALTHAGAHVTHVDAAKNMVNQAKENLALSNLAGRPVRFIVDDCLKFVLREQRRGKKYEGIIMDPPSYGRGPNGEVWKLEDKVFELLSESMKLLSDTPLFFVMNTYTTGLQPLVLGNLLSRAIVHKLGGQVEAGEVGLPVKDQDVLLPCGATGRWMP